LSRECRPAPLRYRTRRAKALCRANQDAADHGKGPLRWKSGSCESLGQQQMTEEPMPGVPARQQIRRLRDAGPRPVRMADDLRQETVIR
jgi:hypothetical protein